MTPEEREASRQIRKIREEYREMFNSIKYSFPNIEIPKIEVPNFDLPTIDFPSLGNYMVDIPRFFPQNIDLSVFKIPNISFPKIEMPRMPKLTYERIEAITNDNSKYGWTLTDEISLVDYLEEDLIGVSQEEKDKYFYIYYSDNDWEHYKRMKVGTLGHIESRWQGLIEDCFNSFEEEKYRLIIPTLFTIIEGEMAFTFNSHKGSRGILEIIEKQADSEEFELKRISLYSVVHSMKEQLFLSHEFKDERNSLINRHWILHGRDDPNHWQKVDALRLFNVLSSLQFIKGIQ